MQVCVVGLWHLGSVTAACLASLGHRVTGLDGNAAVVERLRAGTPPVQEPGLDALIQQELLVNRLTFTTDTRGALAGAEVVWVTFDTPVDENDVADVDGVVRRVAELFPHLPPNALVLVSSQLPVGTTRRLETLYAAAHAQGGASFACLPENLRLGQALQRFLHPDRIVAGVREEGARMRITELLAPLAARVEWMGVESAEMSKHATNAFLATSVAFANEIATLCERTGADAGEVERGLKTDLRIGPQAYLAPGPAFSGGTLARDIRYLEELGRTHAANTMLLAAVWTSNAAHRGWVGDRLRLLLGSLQGRRIAVWGLTYKPGTDTLRRSGAVDLCTWLAAQSAQVCVHDPAIQHLPPELAQKVALAASPVEAVHAAEALVVATPWPIYRLVPSAKVAAALARPVVLDPGRFLEKTLGADAKLQYFTVGRGA